MVCGRPQVAVRIRQHEIIFDWIMSGTEDLIKESNPRLISLSRQDNPYATSTLYFVVVVIVVVVDDDDDDNNVVVIVLVCCLLLFVVVMGIID